MHSLDSYLFISAMLFCLGIFGVITRRNAIAVLMGVELILNAANINFIAFSKFNGMNLDGHIFGLLVIVLAAAEAAVALAKRERSVHAASAASSWPQGPVSGKPFCS